MIAPRPGPHHGQLDAAVESLTLQVDRDTVLQARAALLGEALRLKDVLRMGTIDVAVGHCGGDPVSGDAAPAFNERITALVAQCHQYTEQLEAAGQKLGEIARSYGFTEDEITRSFSS
ncbi:WXG100 family type VII secretion target [Pseudonocardia xinjiangensis]|uniref:PE family protein n=1 Tax=Pseudonocardia xinjiangensis TaxID=75289 RepID=A0ABX1RPD4_9PSEU|nr:hypothetical protein [Pseudonocardia xinjiangensis]NMH81205.1 hypothetical protein [Pseudonocardia xinjiangensis]